MSVGADVVFPMQLSLTVALIATCGVALVGIPIAYFLAMREFPGKGVLETLVMLPLVLPPIVTGYYLLLLIGRGGVLGAITRTLTGTALGLTFTWQAAAIASFVIALPLGIATARAAIASVDRVHSDASRILGRSEFETAFYIVLPLAARGVIAGLALAFARAMGEFGATVMVAGNIPGRTNTMALQIYNATIYGDWRTATLLVVLLTAVSGGFLLVANWLTRVVVK